MSNLIRGEVYKLRKSKTLIEMILLSICAGFLLIIEWEHEWKGAYIGVNVISDVFPAIIFGNFIFALLSVAFIITDFKRGGIGKSFSYGYTRNTIILSKLVVFMIFSVVLELIYSTIFAIYVSYYYGFCGALNLNTILYLIRVISIGVIYNSATISIIAMIAIITKNDFFTFAFPIIPIMTFSLEFSSYKYIPYILSYLPYFTGMRAIQIFSSEAEIMRCIVSSIITFIITIGGSLMYIEHKDIR